MCVYVPRAVLVSVSRCSRSLGEQRGEYRSLASRNKRAFYVSDTVASPSRVHSTGSSLVEK